MIKLVEGSSVDGIWRRAEALPLPSSCDLGVVDVDSHFQEPVTWLVDVDPRLARRCSGDALLVGTAHFVGVDPGNLPKTPFWSALSLWASEATLGDAHTLVENARTAEYFSAGPFDASRRIEWLDEVGIDHQVCNPTVAAHMVLGIAATEPLLTPAVVEAYNEWALAAVSGFPRLHPTSMVDLSRPSEVCRSLRSMAKAGSLTFLVPIDERLWVRLAGDDAGMIWNEVSNLGLSPLLHLGMAAPSKNDLVGSRARWADTQLRAQRCLLQWVSSRWAAQHPLVTILVEELGVDWAIPWLRNIQRAESTNMLSMLGDQMERDRSLIEIASSQVMWVPLPRDPIEEVLASIDAPAMLFGSDFPHSEGWDSDPLDHATRRGWDPSARAIATAKWCRAKSETTLSEEGSL